jgi:hypothetical protein
MEESQQYQLVTNLCARGFTVFVEPSDKLPQDVILQGDFIIRSKQDLVDHDVKFLEITL